MYIFLSDFAGGKDMSENPYIHPMRTDSQIIRITAQLQGCAVCFYSGVYYPFHYSLGSTGSLSNASTPNEHSCTL